MMFDMIGVLRRDAVYDADNVLTHAEVIYPGFHVNTTTAILAERPDLEPYVVTPETLMRVWAGDDPDNPTMTVALRFADEAEALAVIGAVE